MTLKKRFQIIRSDTVLFSIIVIHTLLVFFHCAYSFFTDYWQCYVRAGFCFFIALSTFFFLRKGFSYSILIYAYVLLYFNRFFNYTSFLFVLFAIYANSKIEKHALILYALNLYEIYLNDPDKAFFIYEKILNISVLSPERFDHKLKELEITPAQSI